MRRLLLVLLTSIAACAPSVAPTPGPTTPPEATGTPSAAVTQAPSRAPAASATTTTRRAPTGPTENAQVVRIVDGDTIIIDRGSGQERLRYIGMDTPESVKPGSPIEWLAGEASAANTRLVKGKAVVLEKDVSERDGFGRLLRYVWLDAGGMWTDVQLELVREGFARIATFPPDVKYASIYLAAQVAARRQLRGLWGPGPLDFLSPTDGAIVRQAKVTVTGTAGPGVRVVEDIPKGFDRDTIAAADGSWSLIADLKRGVNLLKFRIGDEKATTRTLSILYTP